MNYVNHQRPVPLSPGEADSPGNAHLSGFPRAQGGSGGPAIVRPTPLPKRPKGRWFVGLLMFAAAAAVSHQVWTSFFRYQAYGTVTGRVLHLSPPWDGVVHYLHVKDGQRVHQGDLLVTVDNADMRHKHAQLGDELRLAQSTLEAEAAKLKWQLTFNLDQGHGALAQYYETLGLLLREQAELDFLRGSKERANHLHTGNTISEEDYARAASLVKGQEQKVAQLVRAVEELKSRAEQASALVKKGSDGADFADNGYHQLKPFLTRIETLQADRVRLQERLDQGMIRAPTNGLVVKIQHFSGEVCKVTEPFITFLEEDSLRITLYVPQRAATAMQGDAEVSLILDPYQEPLECTVARLGDEFEPAPEHLKRYYSEGEKLLPIILYPKDECARWVALRVGGVVKLPYGWPLSGTGRFP
ncbi:MAG: HlyD family secretion protein [Gemmataceae bacterium]